MHRNRSRRGCGTPVPGSRRATGACRFQTSSTARRRRRRLPRAPAEAAKRPFADAARQHGVDPLHAVIAVELGAVPARNRPPAPGHAARPRRFRRLDPRQNVDAAVAYLRRLTDEFGTCPRAGRLQRRPANTHRSVHRRPPPPATRIHPSPNRQPALPPACRGAGPRRVESTEFVAA